MAFRSMWSRSSTARRGSSPRARRGAGSERRPVVPPGGGAREAHYTARMANLRVDVWSDIACPWCYVGKRRLEAAIGQVAERGEIEVVWHAFELDPSAPRERDRSQTY